jgi:hypothetical protein
MLVADQRVGSFQSVSSIEEIMYFSTKHEKKKKKSRFIYFDYTCDASLI